MQLTSLSLALTRAGFLSFSPASLFTAGEPGVWYDPSDIERYTSQLGPELVTNGDFSNGTTGWTAQGTATPTLSVVSGELRIAIGSATNQIRAVQTLTLVSGKTYKVTGTTRRIAGDNTFLRVTTSSDGSSTGQIAVSANTATANTEIQLVFTATATTLYLVLGVGTNASPAILDGFFDNISVRELTAIDTATMFQDAAGTTPVTAVEQPVGLMLDKSRGLVLGPELVTNGDFATDTAWTKGAGWTISGGAAVGTATSGDLFQNCGTVVGRWYQVTLTVTRSAGSIVLIAGNTYSQGAQISASGTYKTAVLAAGSNSLIVVRGSTFTGTVDNISVRELPGNHATQTTSTSRPVLSARYNLLTKTEQFDDAVWGSANTGGTGIAPVITPNAALAPDGTMTADRIVFNLGGGTTTSDLSRRRQVTTSGSAVTGSGTYSFWARTTDGISSVNLLRENSDGFAGAQITVTGEWTRFTITSSTYTVGSSVGLGLRGGQTPAMPNSADILVWGASLVPANQASLPYQRVNTSTDYDADATKFKPYLKFDGVDDWLVTPTITPGTDKAQVFAGVRKLSDAATALLVESSTTNANNGVFVVFSPFGATPSYQFRSKGTTEANANAASGFTSPITNVLTGTGDISGDSAILRVNGTQVVSSTADQGTGNYLAYPLYIGRRGGTTLPFNGHLYGLIVRFGANLPAGTIASTETWLNQRTGAY